MVRLLIFFYRTKIYTFVDNILQNQQIRLTNKKNGICEKSDTNIGWNRVFLLIGNFPILQKKETLTKLFNLGWNFRDIRVQHPHGVFLSLDKKM